MKPAEAAKLASVNPEAARKWKRAFDNDPEQKIPLQKDELYIKLRSKSIE